jgi:alpha-tubulin suppressor-like RCC1 family protein
LKEQIKRICSGSEACYCASVSNKLFSWGWNEHGNLGLSDTLDKSLPTEFHLGNLEEKENLDEILVSIHIPK